MNYQGICDLKREVQHLREELLRWKSVDTTKLKDITDLDECKQLLQRERERSHAMRQEIAATGYGREVVLRRELEEHRKEVERLKDETENLRRMR